MCMRIQIVLRTENKIRVYGLDRPSPMPSSPLSGGADVIVSGYAQHRDPGHPDAFSPPPTQVPCYSYGQKLSKLAILRIACNYILSLARLADLDYSADRSNLSFSECVQRCTRTLQAEGRAKKRKVCTNHSGSSLWGGHGRWGQELGVPHTYPGFQRANEISLLELCWAHPASGLFTSLGVWTWLYSW